MNPQGDLSDETFYHDSAHRLSDEILKILGIPPVLKKILLNPDQNDLESESASIEIELNMNSSPISLTETEQKLRTIWKDALSLSPAEYAALSRDSSLDSYLVGCSTFELHNLAKQIEETFGI
jgi:hypothetical protein